MRRLGGFTQVMGLVEVRQHLFPVQRFLRVMVLVGRRNVVADNLHDPRFAAGFVRQTATHFGGDDFRYMLMLSNCFDFLFFEAG